MRWEYGEGTEGVKPAPGTLGKLKAVVVEQSFPWWYSAVRSLDFNLTNIWLYDDLSVDQTSIVEMACPEVVIEYGAHPSAEFIKSMHRADVVFINGTIPQLLEDSGLWSRPGGSKLRLVVHTESSRHRPRAPWRSFKSRISHSIVGGVTNGEFDIFCHTLLDGTKDEFRIRPKAHVKQNLRWILKSREPGRLVKAPRETDADDKVVWYQEGVIHEVGLLPFDDMNISVVTRFRHNQWVIRKLSQLELLLSLDVPEQLVKDVGPLDDQEWLEASVLVPLKVLQCAIEHFSELLRNVDQSHKRPTQSAGQETPYHQLVEKRTDQEGKKRQRGKRGREETLSMALAFDPSATKRKTIQLNLPAILEEGETDTDSYHSMQPIVLPPISNVIDQVIGVTVATRSDDAAVKTELWFDKVRIGVKSVSDPEMLKRGLTLLQNLLLRRWKLFVTQSFQAWLTTERTNHVVISQEVLSDGWDCCRRANLATWWSWDAGSRPFFWRWPVDYQTEIREGVPTRFKENVTRWTLRQRRPTESRILELMREKIEVVRVKNYVEVGKITSLMSYFHVPKGTSDIRMVYDGTKSGLNDSLWAPWFPLPTADSLVRSLEPGYYMADNDVGEMFHNFMIHKDLRQYCGLDLTMFSPKGGRSDRVWERWNRLAMGLRCSPYNAVQGMMVARERILGDRLLESNVFRWHSVRLNLPGANNYDPSKTWITKVRRDGTVAADVFIYVDDIRISAPTEEEAWKASQRTSSILASLGLQDAARKRRAPSIEAGAWTGSVVWTSNDRVVVLTTQEKWDKTKSHLAWIQANIHNPGGLDNKVLKSIRGFLVYVARTYTSMVPYLKGIHATIDGWRPGRDPNGFKYTNQGRWFDDADPMSHQPRLEIPDDPLNPPKEPLLVFPVERLEADLKCLLALTDADKPPHRQVRMNKEGKVMYGFGDASKQGFGASIELSDKSVMWRSGEFMSFVQERSSNYRELLNLVEYIESVYKQGLLDGCELFIFTDNYTAESAYCKGTSKSTLLFNLVLRLRKIQMSGKCILHMVHVAGTRMIWQGTDGLSRGDRNAGLMAGRQMSTFLPLHLTAGQRSTSVIRWVTDWAGPERPDDGELHYLAEEGWFEPIIMGHVYVWTPPPAVADVAVEMMAQSIHRQPYATHIFLCPRLMTAKWMRMVLKATDATWQIPLGSTIWAVSNHEPLVFSLYLPLSRTKPWRHNRCGQFGHDAKLVQTMLTRCPEDARTILRKLLTRARNLARL